MLGEAIPAAREHLEPIAENMRQADAVEVWLASHFTPIEAITDAFDRSAKSWTITGDGAPIGMFGVCSPNLLGSLGYPWLLGTNDMLKVARKFLRHSRPYVDHMNTLYPHLVNFVHAENLVSLRWLQWCGFQFDGPMAYGAEGADFYRFQRIADV